MEITFYENPRLGIQAHVPSLTSLSTSKVQSWYDASLAVTGPKLWNLIPKSVKCCLSLDSFKSNLDNFMKDIPDRPPVAGYAVQTSK